MKSRVKLSITISKENIKLIAEDKYFKSLGNKSLFIDQVLRKYFGLPNVLEPKKV